MTTQESIAEETRSKLQVILLAFDLVVKCPFRALEMQKIVSESVFSIALLMDKLLRIKDFEK